VDGQHIVFGCKEAQIKNQVGLLSSEEFIEIFFIQKARFVVYNDFRCYIEACVQINFQEFERQFYSTVEEDLMKFRDI